ncbi:MAG: biotin carboxylase N-terminal domain-containing protein [Leptothrix ochracea]|uniref:acetyl/propionyl/methylcrotonyl-CoA carboxylase subunit alpha n=1 Tax=Leptothrix ochracea TaxID=735331 RepID=UPI0034E2474B
MFKKILIANRGEIACRIAATARRLGVRSVAVYADSDAHSQHVAACDEAIALGGQSARDSYLRPELILAAAQASGAEAIHPGYGFLSENPEFAQACQDAGLVFIGPPASAIRAMGLKSAAKRLMQDAGVPLVPGYHGEDQDPARLALEAERIGYPVLIKASAGGGGKGMRIVTEAAAFEAALASCQREAQASFGDAAVLIERYVQRPRHVEIQIFGDRHGQFVHLFERDCSVQRRHQKVLEEAPAPGLPETVRQAMAQAAIQAARAVSYVGAGTVEFIVEPGQGAAPPRFYFMEMNTRLQVEHPVTEAITGLDLVEWQLRIASGEALPLAQEALRCHGHAIEARLCAENPDTGFLPAIGTLAVLRWPEHVAFERGAVRVDTGVKEGDAISPHFDSMIAKIIVWGEDRDQALVRLDAALAQTHVVGLPSNAAFLRRVVNCKRFASAELDTGLIEHERAALFDAPPLALATVAQAVVAHSLAEEAAQSQIHHQGSSDPWSARDGWRMHGAAQRLFEIEHAGERQRFSLLQQAGRPMQLALGAQLLSVDASRFKGAVYRFEDRTGTLLSIHTDAGQALVRWIDPLQDAIKNATQSPTQAHGGGLQAPMPGKVIALLVKVGDVVAAGQAVAVMEAMKIEHTLTAPKAGTVQALRYSVGDQVAEGEALIELNRL